MQQGCMWTGVGMSWTASCRRLAFGSELDCGWGETAYVICEIITSVTGSGLSRAAWIPAWGSSLSEAASVPRMGLC